MPRKDQPPKNTLQRQGSQILQYVFHYNLTKEEGSYVKQARLFVKKHQLKTPAVINIKSPGPTVIRFFWSGDGMYTLDYAEFNYMRFPCLVKILREVGPDKLFNNIQDDESGIEPKPYKVEYAFI